MRDEGWIADTRLLLTAGPMCTAPHSPIVPTPQCPHTVFYVQLPDTHKPTGTPRVGLSLAPLHPERVQKSPEHMNVMT